MPAITPNLLFIDADVAACERAATLMDDFSGQMMLARDCEAASQILSEHLIDLIILDQNAIAGGQHVDSVVAGFHKLKGHHDVPVLIICATRQTGIFLKTHPWGAAYHVPKAIDPIVLRGLITGSLRLKVSYESDGQPEAIAPKAIPKPLGLPLPEVILPPKGETVSYRNAPSG